MKATMKNLNAEIARRWSDQDIEFWKGAGYFYFSGSDGMNISSICVYALNQMDFDEWMDHITLSIEDANR